NALGIADAVGTWVSGGKLGFAGGINYSTPEVVSINSTGSGGVGAINNVSGDNTFAGPVMLVGNSRIGATAGMLTLTGGIDGDAAGRSLAFVNDGDIVIGGVGIGSNIGTI